MREYSYGQADPVTHEAYYEASDGIINVRLMPGMAVSLGTMTCEEESRTQPKCKIVHHLCLVPEDLVDDGSK